VGCRRRKRGGRISPIIRRRPGADLRERRRNTGQEMSLARPTVDAVCQSAYTDARPMQVGSSLGSSRLWFYAVCVCPLMEIRTLVFFLQSLFSVVAHRPFRAPTLYPPDATVMSFEKTSSLHHASSTTSGLGATPGSALGFVHARAGHGPAIDELLLNGMSPNAADADGRSLLMVASAAGQAPIVRSLVKAGAELDWRNPMGHSAVFEAVALQNAEMVAVLVELGADAGLPDIEGCTPLMLACDCGYDAVVDVLCRSSVNLQQRDRRGRTAHDRALLAGHSRCASRIESAQKRPSSGQHLSARHADGLDLPWLVEAPSVSAVSAVVTGFQTLRSEPDSDGSWSGNAARDASDSGLDMRTPLPGATLPSEPVELLRSVTACYEQLVEAVRRLRSATTAHGAVAVLQDIDSILSLRAQIVEDLCFGYLVKADSHSGPVDANSVSILPVAPGQVTLQSLISLFDTVAGSVNWAVMILDSHGDDEGAELLRDARRELTRTARAVRKLAEL